MGISLIFPTGSSLSSVYLGLLSQPTLLSKHWPQEGGTLMGTQPRLENEHSEDVFIHKVSLALKKRKENREMGRYPSLERWNLTLGSSTPQWDEALTKEEDFSMWHGWDRGPGWTPPLLRAVFTSLPVPAEWRLATGCAEPLEITELRQTPHTTQRGEAQE